MYMYFFRSHEAAWSMVMNCFKNRTYIYVITSLIKAVNNKVFDVIKQTKKNRTQEKIVNNK